MNMLMAQEKVPVRIAWSTRNWWLNISTILISAGTLQPTYTHKTNANQSTSGNAKYGTKRKSSDELAVPPTSTISPGTISVAGRIEKQPKRNKIDKYTDQLKHVGQKLL
jgi:hypothetical protein